MSDRTKAILWHLARLALAAGLVAYVVSNAELTDSVRPAPDQPAMPVVRETAGGTIVRTPDGNERLIPASAFGLEGAVRIAGILTVARRLADSWAYAAAAVAVMMLQTPLGAIRWKLLLRVQGIAISLLESIRLTYIGWFFNNWMPGATGGDFIKAYYIAQQTHHKPEAVTVVFLDRLIGLVAMCMMGAAAMAASFSDPRVRLAQAIVAAFLTAVVLAAVVFYSRRIRSLFRVDRILGRLPLAATVAKVDRALFVYRYHHGEVAVSLVYSWGAQVVSVLAVWWLASGLGSRAPWHHYFITMPVIWIGWSLIPVPGGFGVAETLAQKLFGPAVLGGAAPLPAAEAATLALAIMLAYRVVQMVVSLPGGVLYLLSRGPVPPRLMRDEMAESTR